MGRRLNNIKKVKHLNIHDYHLNMHILIPANFIYSFQISNQVTKTTNY